MVAGASGAGAAGALAAGASSAGAAGALAAGASGAGAAGALVVAGVLVDGTSDGVTGSCFLQPIDRPTQTRPDIAANDNNFFILV